MKKHHHHKHHQFMFVWALVLIVILGIVSLWALWGPRPWSVKKINVVPAITATNPQIGKTDAPIKIIGYLDFGNKDSVALWPLLQRLTREPDLRNKILLVWKDFPVSAKVLPATAEIHRLGHCAYEQGKFWEFQALAFALQKEILNGTNPLAQLTDTLRLNKEKTKLAACLSDAQTNKFINDNLVEGAALGFTSAPGIYINGLKFSGLPEYKELLAQVRALLKK